MDGLSSSFYMMASLPDADGAGKAEPVAGARQAAVRLLQFFLWGPAGLNFCQGG